MATGLKTNNIVAGFGDNVAVFGDKSRFLATLSLVWMGLNVITYNRLSYNSGSNRLISLCSLYDHA